MELRLITICWSIVPPYSKFPKKMYDEIVDESEIGVYSRKTVAVAAIRMAPSQV